MHLKQALGGIVFIDIRSIKKIFGAKLFNDGIRKLLVFSDLLPIPKHAGQFINGRAQWNGFLLQVHIQL